MSLLDRKLILVLGKGGVGRSTMAASIASACARRGRKTLLYQSNAADRVGEYFGRPALGTSASELAPGLWGINTSPAAALREYGLMILKFQKVYELIFENRITRAFLRAIPGLDDYAVLGKAWFHTTEEHRGRATWDTIVFDMPASGHSLSMLRIPWVILDTVPEGPLTRDARAVQALLRDPARTAAIVVTLAEEMPTAEARELTGKLAALGIQPQRVLVNQVATDHLPVGSPGARVLAALESAVPPPGPPLDAIAAQAGMARARRALNQHYLTEIALTIPAPSHAVPYLARTRLGPAEIATLAKLVEAAMASTKA
ncbi:MAG TPA: ArsA family ATPase [Kofleriaceae bacterium]|nr:ArsA family ATPase [Kofleriaceae bacterium]